MFTFRAMNTDITVNAAANEEAIATSVAATFAEAERRFSRFLADSELSRLNRAHGAAVVSPELFDVLARARTYVELTDGLFDPGIGATLVALGYDRSFARGALDRIEASRPPRCGNFLDVILEPETRTVYRPDHIHIDLGGMVKGRTVDAAVRHLAGPGAIDAGGDAVLRGPSPTAAEWLVEIEDPARPLRTVATLAIRDGAVATSATNRRRWSVGETVMHHLIDPRTQSSAISDLLQVTVIASSAEFADVLAKTAFLLGSEGACRFLEHQAGVGGVLIRKDSAPMFIGALDVREVNCG